VFLSLHFEDAVAAALESRLPGTIYLAAVSGGADSVAMLVALAALRERWKGFDLRCIHIEHGIRQEAESRGDAKFVRSLCEKYRIPCRTVSVKPGKVAETARKRGIGIEAAARLYRHRAWSREAVRLEAASSKAEDGGQVRILTAHTADDMLETVLMRILRGVGPSGLGAMPASRGRILRPLLALSRRDVLSYLVWKKVPWREDSTNADTHYLRNRIRHRLIPLIAADFPQWRKALSSLAETQALAADFIVNEANLRVRWQPLPETGSFTQKNDVELYTDEGNFFAQPAIIREEALFQGIDMLLAGSGSSQVIANEVKRSNVRYFSEGKMTAMDLGQVRLRRKGDTIILSRQKKAIGSECGFSLLIIRPGFYTLKGVALEVSESLPGADAGEDAFFALLPFVIRPSFKEDRLGNAGHCGGGKVPSANALSAVDSLGIAAFIGRDCLLQSRRDASQIANEGLCVVKIKPEGSNGGINVQ